MKGSILPLAIGLCLLATSHTATAWYKCTIPDIYGSLPGTNVSNIILSGNEFGLRGPDILGPDITAASMPLDADDTSALKLALNDSMSAEIDMNMFEVVRNHDIALASFVHTRYKKDDSISRTYHELSPIVESINPGNIDNYSGFRINRALMEGELEVYGGVIIKVQSASLELAGATQADHYTDMESGYINAKYTIRVVNSNTPWGAFTGGEQLFPVSVQLSCLLLPQQLTMNVSPELNWGPVQTNTTPANKTLEINVTSGTQTPSGTFTFTVTNTNANGRINLGGGEVSVWNENGTVEYASGQNIPITSRNTKLMARLNTVGATPGPAEAHMTVTMTVN